MRTLLEIIEAVKDNEEVTLDELKYALLAIDALWHFDKNDLSRLRSKIIEGKPVLSIVCKDARDRAFHRVKAALEKNPKEWLGWKNDPKNPEYQEFRKFAFALAKKATGIDFRENLRNKEGSIS